MKSILGLMVILTALPTIAHADQRVDPLRVTIMMENLDAADDLPDAIANLGWDYLGLYSRARHLADKLEKANDSIVSRMAFCLDFSDPARRHKSAPKLDAEWRSTILKNHVLLASLNDESLTQWGMIGDYCASKVSPVLNRIPSREDALSAAADIELVALHAVDEILDVDIQPMALKHVEKTSDSDTKSVPSGGGTTVPAGGLAKPIGAKRI